MIVDALAADKRDEAAKRHDEFRVNLDTIEATLYRPARETLHETDRSALLPKVEGSQARRADLKLHRQRFQGQMAGPRRQLQPTLGRFQSVLETDE